MNIIIPVIEYVKIYTNNDSINLPDKIKLPINVEENTAGNLAIKLINKNLLLDIGRRLPKYVIKSFGTIGKKYNKNVGADVSAARLALQPTGRRGRRPLQK